MDSRKFTYKQHTEASRKPLILSSKKHEVCRAFEWTSRWYCRQVSFFQSANETQKLRPSLEEIHIKKCQSEQTAICFDSGVHFAYVQIIYFSSFLCISNMSDVGGETILQVLLYVIQSTLSKADTLGTEATVRSRGVHLRESSCNLIPKSPNWNQGFLAVYNDHMTDRLRLF